jgi:hypothetical protein
MDDANIDNEDEQQQLAAEQDRIATDAAAAAAERRRFKSISVLERKERFSLRTRNKIDQLVETFLENLGDDIHDMLCDNGADEDYRGLDSDRDTDEEIETTIRFFPGVLTRKGGPCNEYPIQCLVTLCNFRCNVKAISLISLLARLSIELGLFEEQERGGLLCENSDGGCYNILQDLMNSDPIERHNREQHREVVDDKYLEVLIQLRKMGLLMKEDIQRYDLLNDLCGDIHCYFFAEKRFQFLVEWDPSALNHPDGHGDLPLHDAVQHSSIRGFQLVFEYGIRYLPEKKGINLLFLKSNIDKTPFQCACAIFGRDEVMKVVEDTLILSYSSSNNTPLLNVVDALLTDAIDEHVHLDCVYFLMRREPDVLMKLLSYPSSTVAVENNSNSSSNKSNDKNCGISNSAAKKLNSKTNTTTKTERKRKRD